MDTATQKQTSYTIIEQRNPPQHTFQIVGTPKFWLGRVRLSLLPQLSMLQGTEGGKLGDKLKDATSIQWSVLSRILLSPIPRYSTVKMVKVQ